MIFTLSKALKSLTPAQALDELEVAGGSVCGRDHARVGRPNQDALCWTRTERGLVAVVGDGCGSGRHSEVGAKLGARLFAEALARRIDAGASVADPSLWKRAQGDVLALLRVVANTMGGSLSEVVSEYFLFTIVGAAITPTLTAVFSIGDGLVAINGDVREIGPYPGNQPPYLGYALLENGEAPPVDLQALRPTVEIESILIGTDGANDLFAAAGETLPGRDDRVGPISRFWSDDTLFRNRDATRRRLALINREQVSVDWATQSLERASGLLPDDTTVIAIRRKGAAS